MKILYLTPFDPTEKDGGGFVRSKLMWMALQSIGEVDTIVVLYDGVPYRKPKERICGVAVPSVFRFSLRFSILQFLTCFLRHMDWAFLKRSEILSRLGCTSSDYDCVVVRYEWIARRTAAWKIAPMYLDFDDLPSEVFQTIVMPKMTRFRGCIHLLLEKWWERFVARQSAGIWLANADRMSALPFKVRKNVLCNVGVLPSDNYYIGHSYKNIIVTVGAYGHEPNRTGLNWFLSVMWPEIYIKFPELELHIIGRIPDRYRETARRWALVPGVKVLGFVDNIEEVYENALCSLASITSGSGTCVKVIESALHGRMVLATQFAARGFSEDEQRKLGVLIFKDVSDISKNISWLLHEDHKERERRLNAIQHYAREKYSFKVFKETVANMLMGRMDVT